MDSNDVGDLWLCLYTDGDSEVSRYREGGLSLLAEVISMGLKESLSKADQLALVQAWRIQPLGVAVPAHDRLIVRILAPSTMDPWPNSR